MILKKKQLAKEDAVETDEVTGKSVKETVVEHGVKAAQQDNKEEAVITEEESEAEISEEQLENAGTDDMEQNKAETKQEPFLRLKKTKWK